MKYFYLFLGNWHWFLLALMLSVAAALFINKYSPRVHRVSASLLIETPSGSPVGPMFGGADLMAGYGFNTGRFNLQNQVLIMKSTSLISKTIRALDFSVTYYSDELFGPRESLNNVPFIVLPDYSRPQPLGVMFTLEIAGDGSMKLGSRNTGSGVRMYSYFSEEMSPGPAEIRTGRTVKFGEEIVSDHYAFAIVPRNADGANPPPPAPGRWFFSFSSYADQTDTWSKRLSLKSVENEASMVSLEILSECPEKAKMFLDKHIEMYLQRTLDKKNQVATNTISFIDRQLSTIADSLDITEGTLQDFRRNREVVDLSFQSQQLFAQAKELDNQKAAMKMQDDYFRYLLSYLAENRDAGDIVAPSVMGISDPLLNNLVLELNRMADQKIAMGGSGASRNPYLTTLESQIRNAKARLEENARNLLNNTNLAMRDLNNRLNSLMTEIRKLPQTERELLGIERKFKLNDNIYTYLLQRRAEAQITKASNTPDNEIIDNAIIREAVKPRPARNLGLAAIAGLVAPALVLVLMSVLNNRVESEEDIKAIADIPVAGHIIHSAMPYQTVVLNDPKSRIAETFRNLRTRLQFFTREIKSPVILITSSVPEEGKSFTSVNLASVYSLAGKKTVLIGFDLRRPKIFGDFNLKRDAGISTYLIGQNTLDEIIQDSEYRDLSVIVAGPVPPNPAELAGSAKTRELFDELRRRFDYIIIDSAPLGAVSDSYSLAQLADITVILVRHNKTVRHILENTIADAKANGIKNMSLLLNDISRSKGVYGYSGRYRYGYGNGYGYYSDNGNGTATKRLRQKVT
jgi:capsular exopolysaccharide synthesis family protein